MYHLLGIVHAYKAAGVCAKQRIIAVEQLFKTLLSETTLPRLSTVSTTPCATNVSISMYISMVKQAAK